MVNFIEKKYYHYVNEKYLYIANNTVTSAIRHTTGQFTNCKEIITVIRLNESFHVSKFWEYIPIQSSYQDTNIHWYCENHEDCKDFEWGSNLELMRMVANVHNKANAAKKNMSSNENHKLLLFLFFKWGGWKIWLKIKC